MNRRNVEALTKILAPIPGLGMFPGLDVGALAVELAARGCLVPAALTEAQAYALQDAGLFSDHSYLKDLHQHLAEHLTRIAQGGDPP